MAKTCPQCRAPILETQRFCRYCGHRLDHGFQDYIDTERADEPVPQGAHPGNVASEAPTWIPMAASPTTPLEKRRRRPGLITALVSLFVVAILGAGLLFFSWLPGEPKTTVTLPATPPSPPERPPSPPPSPAQPRASTSPTPTRRTPGQRIERRIGQLLAQRAIRLQHEIDSLKRRLQHSEELSDRERQELLAKVEELENKRLEVLAAVKILQSETLRDLLRRRLLKEDALRAVEEELNKLDIHIDEEPNGTKPQSQ
ncbi:MAG: zinc-ribbon domain-containing protein [Acidobacteria bacterium]|nr:MAG: zinc-ribbon domain-containing protein [Acidobacteriota bacterium]